MSTVISANPAVNRRETLLRMRAVEAQLDSLVKMGMGGAVQNAPLPIYTATDAFDLAVTLAENGTDGLPLHSHIETISIDTTTPLQRPYGRTYTQVCTSVTISPQPPDPRPSPPLWIAEQVWEAQSERL
jgi:hypothetical protein